MNDTQIAWTRTTVNSLWLGLLVWLNTRYDWGVDFESAWTILLVGVSAGVVWRVSEILSKVPYLGYVLFGVNKEPSYPQPTPPNPPQPADLRDAGLGIIEALLAVFIILVILVVLLRVV